MNEWANVEPLSETAMDEARQVVLSFVEARANAGHDKSATIVAMYEFISQVVEAVEIHPTH